MKKIHTKFTKKTHAWNVSKKEKNSDLINWPKFIDYKLGQHLCNHKKNI